MDFDLPPTIPVSGIPWERVLPPMLPRLGGTFGSYAWTPAELLIPVKEHTGAAQVGKVNMNSAYDMNCSLKPNRSVCIL